MLFPSLPFGNKKNTTTAKQKNTIFLVQRLQTEGLCLSRGSWIQKFRFDKNSKQTESTYPVSIRRGEKNRIFLKSSLNTSRGTG